MSVVWAGSDGVASILNGQLCTSKDGIRIDSLITASLQKKPQQRRSEVTTQRQQDRRRGRRGRRGAGAFSTETFRKAGAER